MTRPDPVALVIGGAVYLWAAAFAAASIACASLAFALAAGALALLGAAGLALFWTAADAPDDDGHAALMSGLGYPVGRLPRRWTRKDWAELDSLTETAKD